MITLGLWACLPLCSPLSLALGAALGAAFVQPPSLQPQESEWAQDLDFALSTIKDNYVYADPALDWGEVEAKYRLAVAAVKTRLEFFHLMEELVEELHDHHASLGSNDQDSFRLAPSSLQIWAEYQGGDYRITDVRDASAAELAGVRGGARVLVIGGVDVHAAVEERLSSSLHRESDAARSWAIRTLLAGRHRQASLAIQVEYEPGETAEYTFDLGAGAAPTALLTHRTEPGGVEYLRIEDSLGNRDLVAAFDEVMDGIVGAETLVLDLTHTPSGGDSDIARGIMGRFTAEAMPYQRHEFIERPLGIPRVWVEEVTPRGDRAFSGRLVLLVNHWTGSMGEGLTLGLDTLPNSTVVGTMMAGLRGAVDRYELPNSGFSFVIPTERLYHVEGYPREDFYPDVFVEASRAGETSALLREEVDRLLGEEALVETWMAEIPERISTVGHALDRIDPGPESDDDLAWLKARTDSVRVLGMGESTHGTSEFFRVRHRLTRYLVENAGFNVIAFEASAATAEVCDRYIGGEDVEIKDAMGGLGMAIWQVEELRSFLEDLRALNQVREAPVRFFGVDLQNPGASARRLIGVLTQIDAALGDAWKPRLELFTTLVNQGSEDPAADLPRVEATVAELEALWNANEEPYTEVLGPIAYRETKRQMNALRQNLLLFRTSDWSHRDAAMAENTLGIFDVMGEDAKVILWAHNGHVSKGPLSYTGTDRLAMGGGIGKALGAGYYALGLLFDHGQFQANGYDGKRLVFKRYHLDPAPRGAAASYFQAAGAEGLLLDLAEALPGGVLEQWIGGDHGTRWLGGYNVPADINARTRRASHLMTFRPGRDFDGLLYLESTTAAVPLDRAMIDPYLRGNEPE